MGVMLTANLILCEEKTPTSGLILPLLDKLLKHYERKEGNSVFIITLKNAVRQNRELRYRDAFRGIESHGSKDKKQTTCLRIAHERD